MNSELAAGDSARLRPDARPEHQNLLATSIITSERDNQHLIRNRFGSHDRDDNATHLNVTDIFADMHGVSDLGMLSRIAAQPRTRAEERQALLDSAADRIRNPLALNEFREDMTRFERQARTNRLSDREVVSFYQQVGRLLNADDNHDPRMDHLPDRNGRITLARQIMDHAGSPLDIQQGAHPNCGPASIETRTFMRNPSDAARLIADVALTGRFTTKDGCRTVRVDPSLIRPDIESFFQGISSNGRSYASEIFQGTAMSIVAEGHGQFMPFLAQAIGTTGDYYGRVRLNNGYSRPRGPGTIGAEVDTIIDAISGPEEGPSRIIEAFAEPNANIRAASTVDELRDQVRTLRAHHGLPAFVAVNMNSSPFNKENDPNIWAGHWVMITSYNDATDSVYIHNPWGREHDLPQVRLSDLHVAMESGSVRRNIVRPVVNHDPKPIPDLSDKIAHPERYQDDSKPEIGDETRRRPS